MNKTALLFLLSLSSIFCGYSQVIKVNYQFVFSLVGNNYLSQLTILDDGTSVYEIFEKNDVREMSDKEAMKHAMDAPEKDGIARIIFPRKIYNNRIIVKDKKEGKLTFYKEEKKTYLKITDQLNVIDWELLGESKEILDYTCYKAQGIFKGKKYTAWYATELLYSDGPWKFSGLPGLILEIESEDKIFKMKAYAVVLNPKKHRVKTEFKSAYEVYTWKEYVDEEVTHLRKSAEFTNTRELPKGQEAHAKIMIVHPDTIFSSE